jgi:hypothetical protein
MGWRRKQRGYLVVKLCGLGVNPHVFKRASERVWKLGEDQWVLRRSQLHIVSNTLVVQEATLTNSRLRQVSFIVQSNTVDDRCILQWRQKLFHYRTYARSL